MYYLTKLVFAANDKIILICMSLEFMQEQDQVWMSTKYSSAQ